MGSLLEWTDAVAVAVSSVLLVAVLIALGRRTFSQPPRRHAEEMAVEATGEGAEETHGNDSLPGPAKALDST